MSGIGDRAIQAVADSAIWHSAPRADAVIVTKDEDYALRNALIDNGPRVIWFGPPKTRRRDMLIWFAVIFVG